jgi:osmotically-inducible protein OsmY
MAPLVTAAALCVGCATTASLAPPAAPTGADERLAMSVYQALNADPVYFFRHVTVSVDGGVAELTGYVWSTDAIFRARQITRAVPGVSRVVTSQLELERNGRNSNVTR